MSLGFPSTQSPEEDLGGVITDPAEILRSLRAPAQKPQARYDLSHIRLRLAWRLAREIATLNGWIVEGEALTTLAENAYLQDEDDSESGETYWRALPHSVRTQLAQPPDPLSSSRYLLPEERYSKKTFKNWKEHCPTWCLKVNPAPP